MNETPPPIDPYPPELLELLQRQPPARRKQIQASWQAPDHSAEGLYAHMIGEPERFAQGLGGLPKTEAVKTLMLDMLQEFSLPVTLYPEDQEAKQTLASWGLIFPYPPEWGGPINPEHQQWNWVMPVEIAVLGAPAIEIYRFGLPLMLGRLSPSEIVTIRTRLGLPACAHHVEEVLQICRVLPDQSFLESLMMRPEWQEHLFTTQILLEWHGVCHRHELFSFAWGDDTLKPLTDRTQRRRERQIEADLKTHGLLFDYTPPPLEGETEPPGQLIVLPEELRAPVWALNRRLQEIAIHELLLDAGGWSRAPERGFQRPEHDLTDTLKTLICVLEATPLALDEAGALTEGASETLKHLQSTQTPSVSWGSVVELGCLTQALNNKKGLLGVGASAEKLLSGGPMGWSRAVLQLWVEGIGPVSVDQAQNEALGLAQTWLDEIKPLLRRRKHGDKPVEGWWRFVEHPEKLASLTEAPAQVTKGGKKRRVRRKGGRPVPSWLKAPGSTIHQEILCGFPRLEADKERLEIELMLVEGVVVTFRLLALDLLSGLSGVVMSITELSALLQDAMAFAVHLNLPVMFFDPLGQTFIPVRPPTYLVEAAHDLTFDKLTQTMVHDLLAPAGVVEVVGEGESVRMLGRRIAVKTPRWFDHEARITAVSGLTMLPVEALKGLGDEGQAMLLRQISGQGESEWRFWLGRPLAELRRAVAGRRITAFGDGYLEVASRNSSGV